MNLEARQIIQRLGLEPLPLEGGFFRRTWTSSAQLPNGRSVGSAIYFLVTETDFSALHHLPTDELWMFHAGDPIEHVSLVTGRGEPEVTTVGANVLAGEAPQLLVTGGKWQGARLCPPDSSAPLTAKGWALISCTMSPAWDDAEFTLGNRNDLLRQFPRAAAWIHALTR
ncbi:MAG: cupin domain-containing protein [Opitutus sp.]